jgi:hypothetical protein
MAFAAGQQLVIGYLPIFDPATATIAAVTFTPIAAPINTI